MTANSSKEKTPRTYRLTFKCPILLTEQISIIQAEDTYDAINKARERFKFFTPHQLQEVLPGEVE